MVTEMANGAAAGSEQAKAVEQITKSPKVGPQTPTNEFFTITPDKKHNLAPFVCDLTFRRIDVATSSHFPIGKYDDVIGKSDINQALNNKLIIDIDGKNRLKYPLTAIDYKTDEDHKPVINSMMNIMRSAINRGFDEAYEAHKEFKKPSDGNDNIHVFDLAIKIPDFDTIRNNARSLRAKITTLDEELNSDDLKTHNAKIKVVRLRIADLKENLGKAKNRIEIATNDDGDSKVNAAENISKRIKIRLERLGIEAGMHSTDPAELNAIQEKQVTLLKRYEKVQRVIRHHENIASEPAKEKLKLEKTLRVQKNNLEILKAQRTKMTAPASQQRSQYKKELKIAEGKMDQKVDQLIKLIEGEGVDSDAFKLKIYNDIKEAAKSALLLSVNGNYGKVHNYNALQNMSEGRK
jgi:hypothetical protein